VKSSSGYVEKKRWCQDNYLSMNTLEMMDMLREQFRDNLTELGFVTSSSSGSGGGGGGGGGSITTPYASYDEDLLGCVLCSGLYPQVSDGV